MGSSSESVPVHPRYDKKYVTVLGGRKMGYWEIANSSNENGADEQHTIVFVHGNPTSSYMWRNVLPHCEGLGARLIAMDLIGMGDSDKLEKENIADHELERYSLKNQFRYFSAFLEAVGVGVSFTVPPEKNVTFVCHSWGGTLASYWGYENPGKVKGLVSLEVVYVPFPNWERVPKKIRGGVKLMLRKPFLSCCCGGFDLGYHLVIKKNLMIESMRNRVRRQLNYAQIDSEMYYYRKPFPDRESRLPILAFIRSIPINDGKRGGWSKEWTEHVVKMMDRGREWIIESISENADPAVSGGPGENSALKILFISVERGTLTEEDRSCIRGFGKNSNGYPNPNFSEVTIKGGHMITEDSPHEVGKAVAKWFREEIMGK